MHTIAGAKRGTRMYSTVNQSSGCRKYQCVPHDVQSKLALFNSLCTIMQPGRRSRYSAWATSWIIWGSTPCTEKNFLSSPKCPDRLSDLPSPTEWFSVACKAAGAWSWHLHLVPRLRIRGTPHLLHHRPPWRVQEQLYLRHYEVGTERQV